MKILFLATSGEVGGAETSLLEVMASLRDAAPAWRFGLVVPAAGPLAARADRLGIPSTVLPLPPALARVGEAALGPAGRAGRRLAVAARLAPALAGGLSYAGRLARLLDVERPDVVHANGIKMHLAAARACPAASRLVWHVHDYLSPRALSAALIRRMASVPALAVANSRSVAEDLRAVCGDRLRIETVYNAVDLDRFHPQGSPLDLDRLCGLPPRASGTVRIGLVATFARWKGHETFIGALSRIPPSVPVRGFVVGGPVYTTDDSQHSLASLRARAAEAGLGDRLGFTGFVDEPAAAMRALDIVVHASTEPEPFGMVIAEAMACGRAVVASRAGGAAELIEEGVDAVTCPPGSADALSSELRRLADDAALRIRLGRAARATAERRFDRTRLARELMPLYRSIARAA